MPIIGTIVALAPRGRAPGRPETALVGAGDVKQVKPDPERFLKAATMLDVRIEDCLVFEDSPAGLGAAKPGPKVALPNQRRAHRGRSTKGHLPTERSRG